MLFPSFACSLTFFGASECARNNFTTFPSLIRSAQTYCAAPTVQISICNHPKAKKLDQPIRTMVAGAAPSATLIQNLEKIGIHVCHVYGLTET